jgi:hypothetical protein
MAVEFFLSKIANAPAATSTTAPSQPQSQVHPHQIAQCEARTEFLTRHGKSREAIITLLTGRLRIAEKGRNEAHASPEAIQARKMVMSAAGPEEPRREGRRTKPINEQTKAWVDHIDIEPREHLRDRPQR